MDDIYCPISPTHSVSPKLPYWSTKSNEPLCRLLFLANLRPEQAKAKLRSHIGWKLPKDPERVDQPNQGPRREVHHLSIC